MRKMKSKKFYPCPHDYEELERSMGIEIEKEFVPYPVYPYYPYPWWEINPPAHLWDPTRGPQWSGTTSDSDFVEFDYSCGSSGSTLTFLE